MSGIWTVSLYEVKMINLGFTIVPHDQEFFDRILAFAPSTGIPEVNDEPAYQPIDPPLRPSGD